MWITNHIPHQPLTKSQAILQYVFSRNLNNVVKNLLLNRYILVCSEVRILNKTKDLKKKKIHKTKPHLPLPKKEMIIVDMVNFDMSYGFYGVNFNLQHKQTNLFI